MLRWDTFSFGFDILYFTTTIDVADLLEYIFNRIPNGTYNSYRDKLRK